MGFIEDILSQHKKAMTAFPDNVLAKEFIDKFFEFLFIPHPQRKQTVFEMEKEFESLKSYLSTLIYDVVGDGDKTQEIAKGFFKAVPSIYKLLLEDAEAVLSFDPAAKSIEEVLVAYPGFYATAVYRFSHQLYKLGVKILPRFFSEYAHSKTGIDIHPGATI